MEWLNYHHLLYFWTVARTGSVARACEQLQLAQPTISGQLRALEESLGEKLFTRSGRGLALTEMGQVAYRYADEIFSLGRELTSVFEGRPRGRPARLQVGLSDSVPKLVAYRILEPALGLAEPVQIVCHEDRPDRLAALLSSHRLDLMLADAPLGSAVRVRAFNHLLGACGVTFFAVHRLALRYRRNFPASLNGAPFLLPLETSLLRRSLEQWFEDHGIRPQVVGEFQDSALLSTFGQGGAGVFAAPSAIEDEMRRRYSVGVVGRAETLQERFYAISVQRRLKHPAVLAICESARAKLFAGG
ncbi:MAG TPA: transcriptional activator NhaR [Bryobacteraceae bacterium]|nr:transcriptional activator NhaR [Bryobacteraceae bacterium]